MPKDKIDLPRATLKIRAFYHRERRMPTVEELTHVLGYATKSATHYLVTKLVDAKLLEKSPTGKLIPRRHWDQYPLLGSIHAGFPSPAEEELQDTISLDQFLVTSPNSTYLVKVVGDSMQNAGILPGDIVVVDRGKSARHGDIIIAEVDGEWTLKRLCKESGLVTLKAENDAYPRIVPQNELKVGGVITGVVRKY